MNKTDYLDRIGDSGPLGPDISTLTRLHRAHLRAVPFENLDISLGRPIDLRPAALFTKIVERRRGGFCYELNGLFAWLLREVGFPTDMLEAGVFDDDHPGVNFDHMLLRVELPGADWIVDVGFGDSFVEPLRFDESEQEQGESVYRIRPSGSRFTLERRRSGQWQPQYEFSTEPRTMADFVPRCRYQETSPDSHFTGRSVCSLATKTGRITLTGRSLIETASGTRTETPIADGDSYRRTLLDRFGIDLHGVDLSPILDTDRSS